MSCAEGQSLIQCFVGSFVGGWAPIFDPLPTPLPDVHTLTESLSFAAFAACSATATISFCIHGCSAASRRFRYKRTELVFQGGPAALCRLSWGPNLYWGRRGGGPDYIAVVVVVMYEAALLECIFGWRTRGKRGGDGLRLSFHYPTSTLNLYHLPRSQHVVRPRLRNRLLYVYWSSCRH